MQTSQFSVFALPFTPASYDEPPTSEAKRKQTKKEKRAEKKGDAGLAMLVKNVGVKEKVDTFVDSNSMLLFSCLSICQNTSGQVAWFQNQDTACLEFPIPYTTISLPKVEKVDFTQKKGTAELLTETYFLCNVEDKDLHLYYLLLNHPGKTLVFANSIDNVMNLVRVLTFLRSKLL